MTWHLITCEYPPDIGGISDHTAQLASGLAAAGEDVHVWCPAAGAATPTSRPAARGPRCGVHAMLGAFGRADLDRAGAAMDACPGPRHLLVQWVPHGYGQRRMNLGFCLWVAGRARRGDRVDWWCTSLISSSSTRPLRHLVIALVHRLMTVVMLRRRASRLGVDAGMGIASAAVRAGPAPRHALAARFPGAKGVRAADTPAPAAGAARRPLVGHFGSYGALVAPLLDERLVRLMAERARPERCCLAPGARRSRASLSAHTRVEGAAARHRVRPATDRLGDHLAACDLLMQPYPDGVTAGGPA